MTSTRSALDADWLGVCRRAVAGPRADARRRADAPPSGRVETGTRGSGGDRTLVIDRGAESVVLDAARRACTTRATGSRALSEERGEVDFGDRRVRVIIDPIDGSLNAKRGLPHHALSIAVADGETMADVAFGFVYDFGPREEWWARRGEGAWLQRRAARPVARASAAAATAGSRCSGIESADPRWVAASIDALDRHRLPPAGARDDRLVAVPGRRRAVRRDGVAAPLPRRRRRRRPADRPRGRRPRQLPELRGPARRAARRRADARR